MQLESYVADMWVAGSDEGALLRDATSGEVIARASSAGIDFAALLAHARGVGGPALRSLTFHERAALLRGVGKRLMEMKEQFYPLSLCTGATRSDSWVDIEGGIGTLLSFASKGGRELPNARFLLDGEVENLSKLGTFKAQHICTSLEGAAVHINAFNFPVWGMLEKMAPALLAGVPVIVKPATATAYLTAQIFRSIVEMGLLPPGAVQLVCAMTCAPSIPAKASVSVSISARAACILPLTSRNVWPPSAIASTRRSICRFAAPSFRSSLARSRPSCRSRRELSS